MDVDFRSTRADYLTFYTYYFFRRNLVWRILIIVVAGIWIGSFHNAAKPLNVGTWLLHMLIAILGISLLYLIPYVAAVVRLNRLWKGRTSAEKDFSLTLHTDGFSVVSPGDKATFWRWESVRTTGRGGGYIFIWLFHGALYLIPEGSFSSGNDADNFTGIVRNGIEKVRGNSDMARRVRVRRLRWWGLVGFLPNFGVIAGLILFFKGIFQFRDRWLVVIGVADVLFTVLFWIAVTRWEKHSGIFTELQSKMSRDQLNDLFRDIEFYKIQHGDYPDSLNELAALHGNLWIRDPYHNGRSGKNDANYFYKKLGDKYWLFSVGPDHQPFTNDDIFPQMDPADSAKFGLLLRR